MVRLKTKKDIELLKKSGRILVKTLRDLEKRAKAGVTLLELEDRAREIIKNSDAAPAFFGYKATKDAAPYPAAICASVNDTIVHGIPHDTKLEDGDLLSIDIGIKYQNLITDAAITVAIGNVSKEDEKLLKTANKALKEGLKQVKPGKHIGDIGHAIEQTAKRDGFHIIEKLTGHGVGFDLHEPPAIFNYGEKGEGIKLEPGMVLAIEPMITSSSGEIINGGDGSFKTRNGTKAAHVEKTIAVTERGCLDLTPW